MNSRPKTSQPRVYHRRLQGNAQRSGHATTVTLPPEQMVYGLHAAEAAIGNSKRIILNAFLTENASAKLGPALAARQIAVTILRPSEFEALVGANAVHQGAVLHVKPLAQPSLEGFLNALPEGEPAVIAILDQISDPHNVGAVLRSAAAFGVAAMIVQDRHSPPLSGTLAKAASGGLEHVPVIAAVNLTRAIERLKEEGFYCIGFDSDAPSHFDACRAEPRRLAVILGAEDRGIRRLLREHCDELCALPSSGAIKSLNVSNAAAIVFYECIRSRGR